MTPVRIWEEPLVLRTYLAGPRDPNPPLASPKRGWVYPYPMLDDLTGHAVDKTYHAVMIENEYLRLTVLPELGGHLYSVFDKTTGREVFYRNHVVKLGLVAQRGAWISGGIEFNFPIGHSTTTVTPVDHACQAEPDGSATCWVGNLERVGRMKWLVGVRLRPGRAYVETDIRLLNRTALAEPYYFWSNSAVAATDGLQMIFPAYKVLTVLGPTDYPVRADGVDITYYKNHRHADDIFAVGSLENFFGCHWHDTDTALVHWNDHRLAVGKKFFTWGTAHDGTIWDGLLTDTDGPYVELQSGRFANQGIWELLTPHGSDGWCDYWYPVHGIGMWQWATLDAAVHLDVTDGIADVGVAVTRGLPGACVALDSGTQVVWQETVDLAPDAPLRRRVPLTGVPADATLRVADIHGHEVIAYRVGQQPRCNPGELAVDPRRQGAPDPATLSPDDLVDRATQQCKLRQWAQARRLVERAVETDSTHAGALRLLGELELRRARPTEAVGLLERSVRAHADPAAAYLLGVALAKTVSGTFCPQGPKGASHKRFLTPFSPDRAAEVLGALVDHPDLGPASRYALAELCTAQGRLDDAAEHLRRLLAVAPRDPRAAGLLAAVCRHLDRPDDAARWRRHALDHDPTDLLAHVESALAIDTPEAWNALAHLAPGESPGAKLTEIAADYLGAGLVDDAVRVLTFGLKHAGAAETVTNEPPPDGPDPMLWYWLAHAHHVAGDHGSARATLAQARRCTPRCVFPSRVEEVGVLTTAVTLQPDDAHAHLHLGTLLYALDRADEAVGHWQRAVELDPGLAVARRNLGFDAWRRLGRLDEATQHYAAAVRANPDDWRYRRDLDDIARQRGDALEDRLTRVQQSPAHARAQHELASREVALLNALGHFGEAIAILERTTFLPWEGQRSMRRLYVDAYLGRARRHLAQEDLESARRDVAQSLEYPDHLGVGRPYRTRDAKSYYLLGSVMARLGHPDAAAEQFRAAADQHHDGPTEGRYWQLLAAGRLGEDTQADVKRFCKEASRQAAEKPDDADAQFVAGLAALVSGQHDQATVAFRRATQLDPQHVESRVCGSMGPEPV